MTSNTQLDDNTIKNVVDQVEYYFSDKNLTIDTRLLQSLVDGEDEMASLAMICSAKRMREYLALGTIKADEVPEDMVQAVADCLRTSSFLKISDDGKKIGRKTPLANIEEAIKLMETKKGEKNQQQRKRKSSEKAISPDRLTVKFKLLKRSTLEENANTDVVHHEDLIALFEKIFPVKYMDFESGSEFGYVEYLDSEESRKAVVAATSVEDDLFVKNYVAILEPDFDSLPLQPPTREVDTTHFSWPRRKYNEVKRMENYHPKPLPILPFLQIPKYRSPRYLQDTKCIVAVDQVFAIRWCIPEFHSLVKGKNNPTNHLDAWSNWANSKLKLHFMVLCWGSHLSSDPDATQPPLMFFDSTTEYLDAILDLEYPCLLNPRQSASFRRTSFINHMQDQNILDQQHALELMLCCHETFQMSRLLHDLRHRALEFAARENCPCSVTPPDDPGTLQMRAEDLCTLVRDLLGPNFTPTLHTKSVKKKLVLHELTLYVNKYGQPVVMDVQHHNCKQKDLVNF